DNALRRLQPGREPVRSSLVPAAGNGGQTSLLSFALEAEPAFAEFTGHRDIAPEGVLAPVSGVTPPVGKAFKNLRSLPRGCASVDLSPLGGGRGYQPDLPPLSAR